MYKTVVLNVVGLTPGLLGPSTPHLNAFAEQGKQATINTYLPAVTCSVQATFLTGRYPDEHGVVGNGWYFRDENDIRFWRQSNALIQRPKIWEAARALIQPLPVRICSGGLICIRRPIRGDSRPMYPADGRKLPDVYTAPADLRDVIAKRTGELFHSLTSGVLYSIRATKWIADATKLVD